MRRSTVVYVDRLYLIILSPEDDAEVSRLLKKRGVIAKVARLQGHGR